MKIVLLGAGIQGIATALDLAWNKEINEVVIADYDFKRAEYVSALCNKKYGNKTRAVFADANDFDGMTALFKGCDFVINEVNYYLNTKVMDACLEAGVNYADIGGLYVETVKQVKYHERFKEAGLLAIIGIGGTPGVTNVCARYAADRLDTVDSIDVYCACDDWSGSAKALEVTYAIETIMDEFHMRPIQFLDGEYKELDPRSGGVTMHYPDPIGEMYSYHIMHSEVGTLPEVYRDKGIKRCTFRIAFPDAVRDKLVFLHELGFSGTEPVDIDGAKVIPVRALKRMMELQPDDGEAVINDCDIIKTIVRGKKDGRDVEYILEMICRPVREWPELLGAQVYIGGAPAWAMEVYRRGLITEKGALAPEECIPPEALFEEAAKREMYVTCTKRALLGAADWSAYERKTRVEQD